MKTLNIKAATGQRHWHHKYVDRDDDTIVACVMFHFEGCSANDLSDAINSSYMSGAGSGGGSMQSSASSSKAVLAALRALQEKIRRLETEKVQAQDECQSLRTQIKSIEIEMEHTKQREHLVLQKSTNESRLFFDASISEKNDLQQRLTILEEENKRLTRASEEVQFELKATEEDRAASTIRLRDLDILQDQLQAQLSRSREREQDLLQKLSLESRKKEEEVDVVHQRLKLIQDELTRVTADRASHESRLVELDNLVSQLLSTNEVLVSQLTGGKVSKKQKSVTVPRSILAQTASTKAKAAKKSNTGKKLDFTSTKHFGGQSTVRHLQELHNIYVNMSKALSDKVINPQVERAERVTIKKRSKRSKSKQKNSKAKTKALSELSRFVPKFDNLKASGTTRTLEIPGVFAHLDRFTDSDDGQVHFSTSPHRTSKKENLHAAISSLEAEFNCLNEQYKSLISSTQSNKSFDEGSVGVDTDELVSVIKKMHSKDDELNVLKSPTHSTDATFSKL